MPSRRSRSRSSPIIRRFRVPVGPDPINFETPQDDGAAGAGCAALRARRSPCSAAMFIARPKAMSATSRRSWCLHRDDTAQRRLSGPHEDPSGLPPPPFRSGLGLYHRNTDCRTKTVRLKFLLLGGRRQSRRRDSWRFIFPLFAISPARDSRRGGVQRGTHLEAFPALTPNGDGIIAKDLRLQLNLTSWYLSTSPILMMPTSCSPSFTGKWRIRR